MHREPRCMARSCLLALLATVRGAYFVLEQPFSSTARFFPALTHSVTYINKLVMPCHNRLFLSGSHLMQYLNFIEYRTPAYIYIYILSWMGSWGHSSLKPSAAWGTMQGPSIFFNYKLLAIPNPRSSGGLALEGFGGNCPSAEHAFCLPKAWFNEVLTNELGNDLCLELRLQYELIYIVFLRTKKYPRSGGPKMRASAAYPKGYAARLLKVHRHITVRNSTA